MRNRETFSKIPLSGLISYLESRGWKRTGNWQNRIIIRTATRENESAELLTPVHEHSSRYADRISEAISDLAAWENRSAAEILRDLTPD